MQREPQRLGHQNAKPLDRVTCMNSLFQEGTFGVKSPEQESQGEPPEKKGLVQTATRPEA